MHGFACASSVHIGCFSSGLVLFRRVHATALKPPYEAGRRGGESIARQRWCVIIKIIV
ncbi:hypothetical protein GSR65_001792 [Salmonella enterica subsp. enterica]|nr:hypothetical protein [Salmonella enterica subsp. enterica serovar Braenderup]EDR6132170.1 hypothetical protein [Salmonella enterica subsp. enterica serovar Kiambu]